MTTEKFEFHSCSEVWRSLNITEFHHEAGLEMPLSGKKLIESKKVNEHGGHIWRSLETTEGYDMTRVWKLIMERAMVLIIPNLNFKTTSILAGFTISIEHRCKFQSHRHTHWPYSLATMPSLKSTIPSNEKLVSWHLCIQLMIHLTMLFEKNIQTLHWGKAWH